MKNTSRYENAAAKSATALKYVTFGLGSERFAVPIWKVREVIAKYEVVPLPNLPEFIEGIISLRGDIVPIVDMRKRFEIQKGGDGEDQRIIVLDMDEVPVGIEVDTVHEVLKVMEDEIEPAPQLVAGLSTDYLEGVTEVGGTLTVMLDMDRIFSTTEKIVMQQSTEEVQPEGA